MARYHHRKLLVLVPKSLSKNMCNYVNAIFVMLYRIRETTNKTVYNIVPLLLIITKYSNRLWLYNLSDFFYSFTGSGLLRGLRLLRLFAYMTYSTY